MRVAREMKDLPESAQVELLDAVWGHDRAVTDRTVDVYVLRLRQKIETDSANPIYIRAVRGFGYSFNDSIPQVQIA